MTEAGESKIFTPFTPEQVRILNLFQESGVWHPFTCGSDKCGALLIAKEDGLHCPCCDDYTQNWAHAFMADEALIKERMEIFRQSASNAASK